MLRSPTIVRRSVAALGLGLWSLCAPAVDPPTVATPARQPQLPLGFEANHGQTDAAYRFLARGRGCNFFVAPDHAVLALTRLESAAPATRDERAETPGARLVVTHQLRLEFAGANPAARLAGAGTVPGRANYYFGDDPARWGASAALWQQVRVTGLYPGVDLVYYGNDRRLEYDFVVAPGADPSAIVLRLAGADLVRVDAEGTLVFTLGDREISQPKPVVYQTVNGRRREIAGGYRLADDGAVTFQLGEFDRALPLVIDPVLNYARFFGGTGADTGWDLALQTDESHTYVYLAGETMSANLPVSAGASNYAGGTALGGDAFVAKFDLNSATSAPVYFTYLGGKAEDAALALAVDSDGNAYVTGFTTSTNFPTANPLPGHTNLHGAAHAALGVYPPDAFVAKLSPTGTLAFASFLGGRTNDVAIGLAVNSARDIFLTGYTRSTDFPTNNALFTRLGSTNRDDAFVTRLTPDGNSYAIAYSTYLGGTNVDHGEGIAADDDGNAYVTGYTYSTNFPVITNGASQIYLNNPATDATNHSVGNPISNDAFLAKLSPDGQTLLASTFFGGQFKEEGFRVTLDAATNVYLCGVSASANFPATSTNLARGVTNSTAFTDAFVAKFSSVGLTNLYAVQFGGNNSDQAWDVAVDGSGNAHVVGVSYSTNYPTAGTSDYLRATNSGFGDALVSVLNADGTAFVYSGLLGGSLNDFGYAIETTAAGEDYLAGLTYSTNFPAFAPFATSFAGSNDVFLAKISAAPTVQLELTDFGVRLAWPDQGYIAQYRVHLEPFTTNVISSTNVVSGTNVVTTVTNVITNVWRNVPLYFPVAFSNGLYRLPVDVPPDFESIFFRLAR